MNRVMTIEEVAEYLQLGRRSVYRLAQSGELPGRKILGRWRFSVREIDGWIARRPQDNLPSRATEPSASTSPEAPASRRSERER